MRLKPSHVFSPRILFRRLLLGVRPPRGNELDLTLPWGDRITLNPQEIIGGDILRQGVFDLAVSELAWRLLQPSDRVIDAGANIGYLTLLFSRRVGPTGHVHSFEPHPSLVGVLRRNADRARAARGAVITVHELGLSAAPGEALLAHSDYFATNQGISQVLSAEAVAADAELIAHPIKLESLDHLFPTESIAFLKIDVEGHEAQVLAGATEMLRARRVRHVLFEAEQHGESPGARELRAAGYTLFLPGHDFWGPRLDPAGGRAAVDESWETPSCLATLDPDAVQRLMAPRGWQVLRGS